MDWIYLDNNATTQPATQVIAAVTEAQQQFWANPSSVHRLGQSARQRVELARAAVALLIGGKQRQIIFTSGGTESNNLALRGVVQAWQREARRRQLADGVVLVTTRTEHSAIREPVEAFTQEGGAVLYLPIGVDGAVDPLQLAAALEPYAPPGDRLPVLVSIQWVNNETGVIQPIEALAKVCGQFRDGGGRVLLHVDATQAVGKMPVDVSAVPVDLLTLSAHKFHGPKGVGVLYVGAGVRLRRQILGGPQERQRRGGTENTVAIIGAGVAARLAQEFLADESRLAQLGRMRDDFEQAVLSACEGAEVNPSGRGVARIWNTTNIGFAHLEAEAILLGLSERGVCASAGAACSSGSLEPSPVLLAMGIPEPVAHGSIRFSISRYTTAEQIKQVQEIVPRVISRLRKTMSVAGSKST